MAVGAEVEQPAKGRVRPGRSQGAAPSARGGGGGGGGRAARPVRPRRVDVESREGTGPGTIWDPLGPLPLGTRTSLHADTLGGAASPGGGPRSAPGRPRGGPVSVELQPRGDLGGRGGGDGGKPVKLWRSGAPQLCLFSPFSVYFVSFGLASLLSPSHLRRRVCKSAEWKPSIRIEREPFGFFLAGP